jgi:hypothetical protein
MRNTILTTIIAMFLTSICYAQQAQTNEATTNKLIDHIIGKWQIKTVNGKQTANAKDKAKANQANVAQGPPTEISFKRDMRYTSNSNNNAEIDSGSFRLNENHKRLYLQSDNSSRQPTEWDVVIQNNELTMQADSLKNKNHFKYSYRFVSH